MTFFCILVEIDTFSISDYLRDYNIQGRRGNCISCGKEVCWARERIAAHKRQNCPSATAEEKHFFRKRKASEMLQSSGTTFSEEVITIQVFEEHKEQKFLNSDITIESFDEKEKLEADCLLAQFFHDNEIPSEFANCEFFKAFVAKLNPSYAKSMPKGDMLTEILLESEESKRSREGAKSHQVLQQMDANLRWMDGC